MSRIDLRFERSTSENAKTHACVARETRSEQSLKATAVLSVLRHFALVFKAWRCNFTQN